jgi:polyribonucleotide nucleotidyltransferase
MKKAYKLLLNPENGFEIEIEINDWAQRANVSLLSKCKGTVVLTTVVLGDKKEGIDFTPLTVDYEERYYAAGKIYGSRFIRREGRPSETAILNARLIDRSIRPALKNFPYEIQIINTIFSLNPDFDPDILAFLGSSLGVGLLGFEWKGPVGAVKICKKNGNFVLYPTEFERASSDFTIFLGGVKDKINMIELEGKEIKEEDIVEACEIGIKEINKVINFLENIIKENVNKFESIAVDNQSFIKYGEEFLRKHNIDIEKALFNFQERPELKQVFDILNEEKEFIDNFNLVYKGILFKIEDVFKKKILENKVRPDGRKLDEIRKIEIEVDVLPRAHGSALFKRGLTHILSGVTLASLGEELWVREIEFEGFKRFMHHYNFPPYSVGEIGSSRAPSRREIGHGNLVEKALKNLIPSEEEFPYTIRVVSDVLSSNGSTSMGSVCASSLALFDAGVPIKKHTAGISIGIAYQDEENYELLTDIQGPEDFFGGMDFKVAGTRDGITAIQLDVKIDGLTTKIIEESLKRAREAINKILDMMYEKISEPRKILKEGVPYVSLLKIDPSKIGLLIGPGGKNIHEIIALTNAKIDIKPDGVIYISAENEEMLRETEKLIKSYTNSYEVGEMVEGEVIKILPFGAILNLGGNRTALLHISEISDKRIDNIEKEIKLGEKLKVRIKNISEDGKIYVSLKDAR